MKRKFWLALLSAVMIGTLSGASFSVSATEITQEESSQEQMSEKETEENFSHNDTSDKETDKNSLHEGTSDKETEINSSQPENGFSGEEAAGPDYFAQSKRTGWYSENGYKFYYKSAGKLQKGWKKIDNKLYYFRKKADENGPKGSMVKGFCTIGEKRFYFSKKGILQYGGWRTIKGKNYYLTPRGNAGTLGAMYTGLKKIGDDIFCFQEDGSACVGWTEYNGKKYFFSNGKKLGVRGRAITGWRKIGSDTYYFADNGVMQKNRWIDGRYVDKKGRLLRNGISPAGYRTDENGRKIGLAKGWYTKGGKTYYYVSGKKTTGFKKIGGKKYYFNKNGVRKDGWITVNGSRYYLKDCVVQTGWQTIGGVRYHFKNNGKMSISTVVDGIVIGTDGIADTQSMPQKSVLIIAGHGQGDSGAVGYYSNAAYREDILTREFATLIAQQLRTLNPSLNLVMYDQNYDCYQVLANRKPGPDPEFKKYDYVLEVHFNATVASGKDAKGDGSYKGIGMYVNSAKGDTAIDRNIVASVANRTGFRVWGGGTGIFKSSGLLNAKTCQKAGVSYGLLETAFIDDKDDITFYQKNKNAMAQAVAEGLNHSLADLK